MNNGEFTYSDAKADNEKFYRRKWIVIFFDIENGKILRGYPKTMYTEVGYYSDYVEGFLGAEVESNLGELLKFIKDTEFETGDEPLAE